MLVTNKSKVLGAIIIAALLVILSNLFGNFLIPSDRKSSNTNNISRNKDAKVKNHNFGKPIKPHSSSVTTPSAEKGKKIARKCVSCHSFKKGGKNKVGPNLYNILNRERGAIAQFNYSKAMKELGGKWSLADMDKYIHDPKKFLPGTKMSFKGIKNSNDRSSLILYLNRLAETSIKK